MAIKNVVRFFNILESDAGNFCHVYIAIDNSRQDIGACHDVDLCYAICHCRKLIYDKRVIFVANPRLRYFVSIHSICPCMKIVNGLFLLLFAVISEFHIAHIVVTDLSLEGVPAFTSVTLTITFGYSWHLGDQITEDYIPRKSWKYERVGIKELSVFKLPRRN